LIDNNGAYLKKYILQYASDWDLGRDFLDWLETENHFTNTLVDRIVTGYPRGEAVEIEAELGYADQLLDAAETFHLWVIEGGKALADEIPFHKIGLNVLWTDDVKPYKARKVRILNGAHTALVPYAMLRGFETVGECMANAEMNAYLKKCIFEEIIPTLDLPKAELESFANAVLERFSNPFIRHALASIALNSVSKFKARVLPSIVEFKKRFGAYPETLMTAFDALCAFYRSDMANDGAAETAFMRRHSKEEIFESFLKEYGA
jgi:tagaturonate reductase